MVSVKKMKLVFKNSYGKERELANVESQEEAIKIMNDFMNEHNFKCYYIRTWHVDEGEVTPTRIAPASYTCFDVGSHTEFFYLYD